jgi:hypothetical protein
MTILQSAEEVLVRMLRMMEARCRRGAARDSIASLAVASNRANSAIENRGAIAMKSKGFIGVAVAVLAAGLTVAACGGGSASTPSAKPPTTSPPTSNQRFLVATCNAANKVGVGQYVCGGSADSALITAGQLVCSDFAIGSSVAGQVQEVEEEGNIPAMPAATGATLNTDAAIGFSVVIAAVKNFCPQYLSPVKAYAGGDSSAYASGDPSDSPLPSSAQTTTPPTAPPDTYNPGPSEPTAPTTTTPPATLPPITTQPTTAPIPPGGPDGEACGC